MGRARQLVFLGWFLALIYGVPAYQSAAEILRGRAPQFLEVFTTTPTRPNLRAFEHRVEDASLVAQAVRPWMQDAWFALFRDAGEKVVTGREDWLFYEPDLRYLVEPGEPGEPFEAIVDFRDQLARQGIRLIVLAIPGKPSVYPDRLTSRVAAGRTIRSSTLDLLAALRHSGIEAPDLFDFFAKLRREPASSPWYLPQDTHWSAEGARRAAAAVARRIRDLGWIGPGPVRYTERPVTVRRTGDIARMIRVAAIERHYPLEEVSCRQVMRQDTGEPYRDAADSPVLVLGDSFLRMYETDEPRAAGFIAHLARELGRPLASVVNDGGASTLVRQELSRRPALLEGKKLVIWEFVERDIRFGTEGWQKVRLPAAP
ncbi:MAG TPA: hypothetical protein VFA33_14135 [Bryobacteraceae bacterium]|nr:hypothetical protein [Bryobacteraceae bacterium]